SGIKAGRWLAGFGGAFVGLALAFAAGTAPSVAFAGDVLASAAPAKRPAAQAEAPEAPEAPPSVLAMLRQAGVAMDEIGLLAVPLDGGPALARWNEDRAFNPASTMKLLTTYAALGLLGQDYRWRTGVYLTGLLEGDRLDGDLVLRGGGDPKLVIEDMLEIGRASCRERG